MDRRTVIRVAALAAYDQVKAKSDAWSKRRPDHFRRGDVLMVHPIGIRQSPGYLWLLVKQHPNTPKLWYAVISDDRESCMGETDIAFEAAVAHRLAGPTIGTWLHEDDLKLDNRVDFATSSVCDWCEKYIGTQAPELVDDYADGHYVEHMEDLRRWESVITEILHNEGLSQAQIERMEKAYWELSDQ